MHADRLGPCSPSDLGEKRKILNSPRVGGRGNENKDTHDRAPSASGHPARLTARRLDVSHTKLRSHLDRASSRTALLNPISPINLLCGSWHPSAASSAVRRPPWVVWPNLRCETQIRVNVTVKSRVSGQKSCDSNSHLSQLICSWIGVFGGSPSFERVWLRGIWQQRQRRPLRA